MIIDTHCHLDDNRYEYDLKEVITRAKESYGVMKFIIPGADINDLLRAKSISHQYNEVYFAVGVHPYNCDNFDIDLLRSQITDKKCVAVGECGLDYYRLKDDFDSDEEREENKNLQKKIFIEQIELAIEYKKPLIVHTRDANQDSYDILNSYANNLNGGVLHCYNASPIFLNLAQKGFYFGIGGVLTFKNAKALQEIVSSIPKQKLLLETDAPYLTPEPHRGKRNEPGFTYYVALRLSEILGMEMEELCKLTTDNAEKLFRF
ncbi:TatD family hydrolase [uncultured Campylobacter sp.]|uniref:TatD family hydrolase n=1 Tax=uncultured Campylobacter sp. TaxID=218934 RepID=UPI002618B8DB|nr:TatD family hydrolase [uncultured Campylobacter sp.]